VERGSWREAHERVPEDGLGGCTPSQTARRRQVRNADKRRESGRCVVGRCRVFLQANDSIGLWTFLPLNDVEFDVIAFFQGFVAVQLDCRVVDEYIRPVFTSDESVALGVVEPLDLAFVLSHRPPLSLHRDKYATGEDLVVKGNSPRRCLL
jgi:hypothetical protein